MNARVSRADRPSGRLSPAYQLSVPRLRSLAVGSATPSYTLESRLAAF